MKRLLMLVGVAAVSGAMYVAAASGGQQSAGPTAQQFSALKKQVAALAKKEKTTNQHVNELLFVYVHCSLHSEIGVDQRGDSSFGYSYSPDGVSSGFTTALDLATSGTPTYVITPYNAADSGCQQLVGLALRHNPGSVLAQFAQRR
jgi:hypothetical protein